MFVYMHLYRFYAKVNTTYNNYQCTCTGKVIDVKDGHGTKSLGSIDSVLCAWNLLVFSFLSLILDDF